MKLSRRRLLSASLAALPSLGRAGSPSLAQDFNFAFLTDIHVKPELRAAEGFKQCLAHVMANPAKPEFVITGGDLIMDALEVGIDRAKQEFDLFDECIKGLSLPVHHTLGNHDVVGWSQQSKVAATDHDYGKKIFAERYGQGRSYRSFDHGNWHFILLDSIGQDPVTKDYIGALDEAQIDWLRQDLAAVGRDRPIIMVSHVPFFSVWHQYVLGPQYAIDKKALVTNVKDLRKLFDAHNIQLVLSGHGHVVERIEVGKITYIQGGAVCGMWWKGPVYGRGEGYGIVQCKADGTWAWQYDTFGWKAGA
jgi:3',5'-cyclic-AMP phosphodiesterase